MQYTIPKQVFMDGLSKVVNVVPPRHSMSILANVLLEAKDNTLYLSATDLDVSIITSVPASVKVEGAVTLHVKRLLSIVAALPDEEIHVEVNDANQATVVCERSNFKINGLPAADFPEMPSFADAKEVTLEQAVLRTGVQRTEYAISQDTTRFVLNGLYVSLEGESITFAATDGRRLAMAESPLAFPVEEAQQFILPTRAVGELRRVLSDTGSVLMRVLPNRVAFEVGETTLTTKLIDGVYPNYKQVIPVACNERIQMIAGQLYDCAKRAALLAVEKTINLQLTFENDELAITAMTDGVGEAHEYMAIDYQGKRISIAFSPEFFMAPLRTMDSAQIVTLELVDETSPGVLRLGDEFLYVIMPMRNAH